MKLNTWDNIVVFCSLSAVTILILALGALILAHVGIIQSSTTYEYKTPTEQAYFDEGYNRGYQEGYDAAKHNLSYGIVHEHFNFTCAVGKNYSERVSKCIEADRFEVDYIKIREGMK